MITPPPNPPWTPDRMLMFLGKSGIRLDLLSFWNGKVIASIGDKQYSGRPAQLRRLAWAIRTDQKSKGT